MSRSLFAIIVILMSSLFWGITQAQSYTYQTNIHLVVEPSTIAVDEVLTAQADQPILTLNAHSPRAVQVLEKVKVGSIGGGVTFDKGTVLFGRYDKTLWTYCGISAHDTSSKVINTVVLGALTGGVSLLSGYQDTEINCLYDEDNDGFFDNAWTGGQALTDTAMLAYNVTETAMTSPAPYESIAYDEGPIMPIELKWSKGSRTGVLKFNTVAAGKSIQEKIIAVPAVGADPISHSQFGAIIEIIAYDGKLNSLTYRVKQGAQRRYILLPATQTVTMY